MQANEKQQKKMNKEKRLWRTSDEHIVVEAVTTLLSSVNGKSANYLICPSFLSHQQ